jgi:hypothetical protein
MNHSLAMTVRFSQQFIFIAAFWAVQHDKKIKTVLLLTTHTKGCNDLRYIYYIIHHFYNLFI